MTTQIPQRSQGRPTTESLVRAAERKDMAPIDQLRSMMFEHAAKIEAIVPRGVDPRRVIQLALANAARDPKILACTASSVLISTAQIAALGLEPGTALQQAYLVPRKNNKKIKGAWVKVMGYRGFVLLASHEGISAKAQAVYHGDTFRYVDGLAPVLEFTPADELPRGAEMRGAFAVWSLKDGRRDALYWSMQKLQHHRDRFAPKDYDTKQVTGPWCDHFDAMCEKTMIRMAAKTWPLSTDRSRQALRVDDAGEAGRIDLAFVPGARADQVRDAAMALGEHQDSFEGSYEDEPPREETPVPAGREPGAEG